MTAEEAEAAEQERRRQERERDQERRRKALAHNDELGAEVARHLARMDPADGRVVRLLAALGPLEDLREIAGRGARYAMPGWVTSEQRKNGTSKPIHLEPAEAHERARDYLAAVSEPDEIAGRIISLVALARYADEDAVARSRQVYWGLPRTTTPWGEEPVDLLDELCGELLPDHLTATQREERAEHRRQIEARRQEKAEAAERVAAALERAADLTDEEREQALGDAVTVHGYRTEYQRIRAQLDEAAGAAPASDERTPSPKIPTNCPH